MPIRILLADDHSVVRQGLRMFLALDPDLAVVGEACNGAEAVSLAETLQPDVVLMDLAMPVMSGLEATAAIRQRGLAVQVIVLTSVLENTAVTAVVRAGAVGYLVKDTDAVELRRAIKAAAAGEPQLSPQIAAQLLAETHTADGPEVLTQRESDVLRLAAQGLSDQEIASTLVLPQPAVRTHLGDIIDKLRLAQDAQAALLDFSSQLLSRSDPEALMNDLVHETRHLLHAEACALLLPDGTPAAADAPRWLAVRAASGWQTHPVGRPERVPVAEAPGEGGPGWVWRTGRPWQVADLAEAAEEGVLAQAYPGAAGEARLREGFRGHALIPLVVEGRSIGILELDSRQPRRLGSEALGFVRLLANQAALLLEQARLRESERQQHGLEDDLAVARQIQLSLLPAGNPEVAGWAFAAAYQSARQVGGDLYDFIELPGNPPRIGLLIADVSGKGASAALFMAYSRAVIRAAAMRQVSPAQALSLANEQLAKDNQAASFISAFYGVLDTQSGRVTYASAGHNPPLVWRAASGEAAPLPTGGLVLGVAPAARYEDRHLLLQPGDVWLLYTDGITEANNPPQELFGVERLRAALAQTAPEGAAPVIQAVLAAVDAFSAGAHQADDYTLVAVKRLHQAGAAGAEDAA